MEEKFEINKEYHYSYIEQTDGTTIETYGKFVIGEELLVLEILDTEKIISFILIGYASEAIYKCVYKE